MMALLSANMGFLLLRILAIRKRRRWALPHGTMGREDGRGEACPSVLPRRLVCNRFTDGSNHTFEEAEPPIRCERRQSTGTDGDLEARRGAHPIDTWQEMGASFTLASASPGG